MKILLLLTLFFCGHAVAGPQIKNAKILTREVAAGEKLRIRFEMGEGQTPVTTGAVSIYLGFIVQNVFIDSDSLQRQVVKTGANTYETSDLIVNPWVYKHHAEYTIENFAVIDKNLEQVSLWAGTDGFYYEGNQKTGIPVMKFYVKDNPNADITPSKITSAKLDKDVYRPGEALRLEVTASDENSGIRLGCCAAAQTAKFGVFEGHGGNLALTESENNFFRLEGLKISQNSPKGKTAVSTIGLRDRAGNWGMLWLSSEDDEFYRDANGPTNVKALRFEVAD